MLRCIDCGAMIKQTCTYNKPTEQRVIRRKKCLRCGRVFFTEEKIISKEDCKTYFVKDNYKPRQKLKLKIQK